MRIVAVVGVKGGSGKTTLLAGLVGALAEARTPAAALDLDLTAHTLTGFIESRREQGLYIPELIGFDPPPETKGPELPAMLDTAIGQARNAGAELLFIDTAIDRPKLVRMACERADLVLTPVQESPVDVGLLLDRPSAALAGVRARKGSQPEWLVVTSRVPHLPTRLGRRLADRLAAEADALGYRFLSGARERVLYREMFETGLTPFDPPASNRGLTMSCICARVEMRALASRIGIAA